MQTPEANTGALRKTLLSPLNAVRQLARFLGARRRQDVQAKQEKTHAVLQAVIELAKEHTISVPGRAKSVFIGHYGPDDVDKPAVLRLSSEPMFLSSTDTQMQLHPDGTIGSPDANQRNGYYMGEHFVPDAKFMAFAEACYDNGPAALSTLIAGMATTRKPETDLEHRILTSLTSLQPGRLNANTLRDRSVKQAVAGGVANGTNKAAADNYVAHLQASLHAHATVRDEVQMLKKAFDVYAPFDVAAFIEAGAAEGFPELETVIQAEDIALLARKTAARNAITGRGLDLLGVKLESADLDKVRYMVFSAMQRVDPEFHRSEVLFDAIRADLTSYCRAHKATLKGLGLDGTSLEATQGYDRVMLLLAMENRIFATANGVDLPAVVETAEFATV